MERRGWLYVDQQHIGNLASKLASSFSLTLATGRETIHCRLATDARLSTSHRPPLGRATAARTCHRRPITGRLESARPSRPGRLCMALLGLTAGRAVNTRLNSNSGCSVSLPLPSLTHHKCINQSSIIAYLDGLHWMLHSKNESRYRRIHSAS